MTATKVADELRLSSDDSPAALTTRPTDVVWKNAGVFHSEARQLGSSSKFCVTDKSQMNQLITKTTYYQYLLLLLLQPFYSHYTGQPALAGTPS